MLLLLLTGAVSDVCHHHVNESAVFQGSTFEGCEVTQASPDQDGGAIKAVAFSLVIASCLFARCQAVLTGGAVSAAVSVFSMSDTQGLNCTCTEACFYTVTIEKAADGAGALEVLSSSVAGGKATLAALYLGLQSATDHANISTVYLLNSSANDVAESGSGLYVSLLTNLSLRMGIFIQNRIANCLCLVRGTSAGGVFCLYVVNNSCDGAAKYAYVIHFGFSATFSDCVFQGNRYIHFATSEQMVPVSVVLVNCVFDVTNLTVISYALFHFSLTNTTNCVQPTWLPTCSVTSRTAVAATPVPSALPQQTAAIAASSFVSGPVIVLALGIGVPGLFLLVVVVIVAVRTSAERTRRIASTYSRVHFTGAFMAAVKDKLDDGMEKDDADGVPRLPHLEG